MENYLLETKEITKIYQNHRAVNRVSLHVKKGAIYGFIGRNGAGKTTTLKMICSLSRPTSGEIVLYGRSGKELEEVKNRVGSLIENPGLYNGLTAYENLMLKYKLIGMKKDGYLENILQMVGLNGVENKRVKAFSLGMKQRLGIALALIGNPDLLVLDEPINGLDPQGITEIRNIIERLNKEHGMTVLISSHILGELSKMATDYGIIHNGELIKEISDKELMKQCQKKMVIELEHPEQALPVLEKLHFRDYQVIDKEHIHVYERLEDSALINRELNKNDIFIQSISVKTEELENYFLGITGGTEE